MNLSASEIVQEFFARMNSNDFRAAADLLGDDFVLEWPQSQERIRGRENFIAVNAEYPAYGRWSFTINRIVGDDTEVASDVSITDGVQTARAITFSTVRAGKIVHQVEFWPEPYPAPANRAHLVEQME